jgi:hypothetical protein
LPGTAEGGTETHFDLKWRPQLETADRLATCTALANQIDCSDGCAG